MYLSIFICLQLLQNVIEFGVQSLQIWVDLILECQSGFTRTSIFCGDESSCFFNGWTCLLVFIQSVASVTVAVIRGIAIIHTDVLATMRAQGTLVKNWPGLGQEREYSQITIGNDTDFWEKEALVWSQSGHIWILQSSESPMFQKEGASSWSLPHSPFLAISCKYFGFCLSFFRCQSWRAALHLNSIPELTSGLSITPPSSPATYGSSSPLPKINY